MFLLAIAILAIAGGFAYSLLTGNSAFNQETSPGIINWKTYESEELGLELQYPDDWSVDEKVLEDPTTGAKVASVKITSPGIQPAAWLLLLDQPCAQQSQDFETLGNETFSVQTKMACINNLQAALNVLKGDPQEETYKDILNQMLSGI